MYSNLSTIESVELRILSIDPGTQKLGTSFSIANFYNKRFTVLQAETIDVDRLVNVVNSEMVEDYSKYLTMVDNVYKLTKKLVEQYQPDWVICESPYMNSRFPLPYALLTLCTQAINKAVKDCSLSIGFSLIDPASVKKEIGAKGNSGDKLAVKTAVINHPLIHSTVNLYNLDEHSSDAIAIGFYGFKHYLKEYNLL